MQKWRRNIKKERHLLDESRKLLWHPSKRPMRIIALQRIALRIKPNRTYTEKEVNSIIKDNALFYHQRYDKKLYMF